MDATILEHLTIRARIMGASGMRPHWAAFYLNYGPDLGKLVEIISYPWVEGNEIAVNIRTEPHDPTSLTTVSPMKLYALGERIERAEVDFCHECWRPLDEFRKCSIRCWQIPLDRA